MESVAKVSGNFYKIPKPCNGQTLHVVLIEIEMLNKKNKDVQLDNQRAGAACKDT